MWTLWSEPNWKRTSHDFCLPILHWRKEISIRKFKWIHISKLATILFHIQNNSNNGWWWPRLYHPCLWLRRCLLRKEKGNLWAPNEIMIFAKMFTYLRPTTVNSSLCGAPTASRQMGTHCGGVANDCRWLCPTYTRGCLYMWTPKCFNYLLTNVNCHQASYWILIL